MRNKSRLILEGIKKESSAIPDEYYQYFYDEVDFVVNHRTGMAYDIEYPDYEWFSGYVVDMTKREYNTIKNKIDKALRDVKFYSGDSGLLIELNDNHTMWELEARDDVDSNYAIEDYFSMVDAALVRFENETGVEVWQAGRSGRHICVENNVYNLLDYYKLCEVQRKLEDEVIQEFNETYGNGKVERDTRVPIHESKDVLDAKKLFDKLCDMEEYDYPNLIDEWNNITGYPDEVRKKRIELINPLVVKFVSEYKDDIVANWEEFSDILTDNNFHTYLVAINAELSKYK